MAENQLMTKGNEQLLQVVVTGILASRIIRPHLTQTVMETIQQLMERDTVFMSGWHSPIEQEIHSELVKYERSHIHAGAKSLVQLTCELDEDKVLFLTHCSDKVHRITRRNALKRNRIICELAEQVIIPWLDPRGKTHAIVKEYCADKPVFIFDDQYNRSLMQASARPIENVI